MNGSQGLERAKQGLRPACNVPRCSIESRSQLDVSFAASERLPGGRICASQSSLASRGQASRDVLAAQHQAVFSMSGWSPHGDSSGWPSLQDGGSRAPWLWASVPSSHPSCPVPVPHSRACRRHSSGPREGIFQTSEDKKDRLWLAG